MQQSGGGLVDIITAVSQLLFTIIFLLMFLGVNQRIQVAMWARDIRNKLAMLKSYAGEARRRAERYMRDLGVTDPTSLLNAVSKYFVVEPVDIEPIDIIRRLERVLRTRDETIKSMVREVLPEDKRRDPNIVNNVSTLAEITAVLDYLYRYVRHILLTGLKYNNWALIMQLVWNMPSILRIARSYSEASKVVEEGRPLGDGAGPLTAFLLAKRLGAELKGEISEDTVYYHGVFEDRDVFIVKARGPGSTVGRPGEAVEKLAKKLGDKLSAIITVDAALKLEGEETGEVALGAGVAMGDPGPEKIRIERVASRLRIPLHAVAIKMSIEEAITGMTREVAEAARKAVEVVTELIRKVGKGTAVIVVGVGNTLGIGQ